MSAINPRIRVMFLIRSLDFGGAQRQLVTLAKALDQNGFDVSVLTFYSGQPLDKELEKNGIKLISIDKRGRWDVLPFLGRLVRKAKQQQPDIIHSYLDIPNVLALLLKRFTGARVVWGVRAARLSMEQYDWLFRLAATTERMLVRFPDLVIVNSDAALAHHEAAGFSASKLRLIHNGIDTDLFAPNEEARKSMRRELGLSDEEKVVGMVGRLDPVKDIPVFLHAAAIVKSKISAARFVCVGSGPQAHAQELRRLAEELGISDRIKWVGALPEVNEIYNALDVLVSASRAESFSNAIAEAMSSGTTCVVTDVGDSSLIVGEEGIVVPPRGAEAMANGIITALANDTPERRQANRARIVNNFSVARLAQETAKAFEELVA